MKYAISLPVFLGLAACGGGGAMEEGPVVPTGPFIEAAPTETTSTRQAAIARFESIGRSSRSNQYIFSPPSGDVTYDGAFFADSIAINGARSGEDGSYGLIGDASVVVSWGGPSRVSGSFTGINLTEGGTPTEQLGGRLALSGNVNPSQLIFSGTANGVLTGGFDTDDRVSVDFDLDYTGQARHPNGTPLTAGPVENLRYVYSDDVSGLGTGGATVDVISGGFFGER